MNYNVMNKLKPIILFNIVTYFVLSLIYDHSNGVGHFSKYLNKKYNNGKYWKERNVRILTNDELYSKMENNGLKEELSGNDKNDGLNNVTESLHTYEELSKNRSDTINSYREKLKYGYTKKKGLKKFGCFCEKIVLDEMDKIGNLSEYKNITKKCFKRIVCHNNGLIITFFTFFLVSGIFISLAGFKYSGTSGDVINTEAPYILPIGLTIFFIILILFLLLIRYIKSKVKKYKKLTGENIE
ncbi:hypothetical protein PVBG_02437 [Plasmodium vivax Brazil I]|uniref:Variable surface protein Vir35 n=1 Tax=Plasmodium vivax (strain Brazil I) TaxID=1033975 RepID=A0A0J9SM57_PLAV1|nr:hypothetical protein PVBG_02437 [Plasmodium vivax Brazil I]